MSSPFIVIDEITTKINELNTSLTTKIDTIDMLVDTINGNVGAIKTATATNNTANASGVLSAKLSYLISRRNRFIKPGSTVLITLSSSGTVSVSQQNKQADQWGYGTNYSCYAKYPGIYRMYATAKISAFSKNSNVYQSGRIGTVTAVLQTYVVHISDGSTSSYSVDIVSGSATTSSATKTIDVQVSAGDRIDARVSIRASHYYDACREYYMSDNGTAQWTDISVRGTIDDSDVNIFQ